jgi:hypothetical protein
MVNKCLKSLCAAYEVLGIELQYTRLPEDGINGCRNSEQKLLCDLVTTVVVHGNINISTLYH